jgi:carbon storage regulator CsrA
MLVLSRKSQESVVIGGSDGFQRVLKVTVLEIGQGKVRLGFQVDQDVPVHRLEVWERIHATGPPEGPGGRPGQDETGGGPAENYHPG